MSTKSKIYIQLVNYIKSNQDKFYRVAYSYTKSKEDSLDIVQESVFKALKNYHQVRDSNYLSTWFYRILINTSISHIKKVRKFEPTLELQEWTEVPDNSTSVEHDSKIDLYQAIDRLDGKKKSIIILRFFEDKKFSEISEILGMNINTVKTKLRKILSELKYHVEEVDYE